MTDRRTKSLKVKNLEQQDVPCKRSRLGGPQQGPAAVPSSPRPYFDPAMVVSWDAAGNPVSRYGDRSWNFSSQSNDGTSPLWLHFLDAEGATDPTLAAISREQQKALIWLYIDAGKVRAPRTTQNTNWVAVVWAKKALSRGIDLFGLLVNPELVSDELASLSKVYLAFTSGLIHTLCRNSKTLGVDAQTSLQKLRSLIADAYRDRPEYRQTPLIPSRIYCAILGGLVAGLDEIERDLDELLDAYRQSVAASRAAPAGASKVRRQTIRDRALVHVVESMRKFGYDSRRGGPLHKFIEGRINYYQVMLMHTVAGFSGMRVGEVSTLPLHGAIETFEDRGSLHYVINGYTYKLERGVKKAASWITSREGYRAILLGQRIATAIAAELGGKPTKGQTVLLFCSTSSSFKKKSSETIRVQQERLIDAISPLITQEDIDELNRLELDRAWQRDGIEVGSRWPLAFHQLRRSLSVYAHRSGMVSLPALKAQLQHITDEMRAYYADGYCRAVNLVFDRDHFSHDWNAAKAESSYFGFALALLLSDDDVMGRGADRALTAISTRSRDETVRLFRQGKLAYKETVLGGCVSTEECKTKPLEPIPFECLETDCVNQVVLGKRLDYIIRTQETVVVALERDDRGSVEHRLEADHLSVLLKARQRWAERRA